MPGPLVSEGADLEQLLAEVNAQPGAEILYQDRVRRGGVCGFFTREVHRIAYRVAEEGAAGEQPADDLPAAAELPDGLPVIDGGSAADLLAAAVWDQVPDEVPDQVSDEVSDRVPDERPWMATGTSAAAELYAGVPAAGQPSGVLPELDDLLATAEAAETPTGPGHTPTDFATLLRSLTEADPPADAHSAALPVANGPTALPADRPEPVRQKSNVTAIGKPDARARLELLMQLRQVGVPVSVNPRTDTHTLYEALESILEELPAPALPPRGAGDVLAVVGESGAALQAARTCAAMLRIPAESIGVAGLAEPGTDHPVITGQAEALRLRTELRRADLPSIVVIATDATVAGPDDPWAAEMLAALCPTAVWAVVDARWKTEDSRAQLDRLGRVDALVVHSAQLSASPASVWDLDLPLGLLDGRAASTFAWTGLLFPLLRGGARHRASA